jgi:hypothetical protein
MCPALSASLTLALPMRMASTPAVGILHMHIGGGGADVTDVDMRDEPTDHVIVLFNRQQKKHIRERGFGTNRYIYRE